MDLELDELVKTYSDDLDDEALQLVDLTKRLSKAQTRLEFITILQKILKKDDIKNGFINTIEKDNNPKKAKEMIQHLNMILRLKTD
jgi:uncharacterized tellurite resistance protein B-like protein